MNSIAPAHAGRVEIVPGRSPSHARSRLRRWGGRAGIAAFLFFLAKGIAWLVIPATLAAAVAR